MHSLNIKTIREFACNRVYIASMMRIFMSSNRMLFVGFLCFGAQILINTNAHKFTSFKYVIFFPHKSLISRSLFNGCQRTKMQTMRAKAKQYLRVYALEPVSQAMKNDGEGESFISSQIAHTLRSFSLPTLNIPTLKSALISNCNDDAIVRRMRVAAVAAVAAVDVVVVSTMMMLMNTHRLNADTLCAR